MYYSSTTLYCAVLQGAAPVLLCTTPVLLCTTKYYSSTTLYYKVLFQYDKVQLQYYSVLQSTTLYYEVLLRTTEYNSSTTLYYKVALMIDPWHIWTVIYTARSNRSHPPTSPNTKILRLPRKMNLMIDTRHVWNVTYNARSNRSHPPTSRNTAPATQNESHDWSASHMKRHLQCAEQQESSSNFTKYRTCHEKWISWLSSVTYETPFTMRGATRVTLQLHQILRLPRNSEFKMSAENPWIASANIKTIRRPSEHDPRTIRGWNRHLAHAASETLLVASWRRILYWKIQHFALRLSPKISRNAAPATKSDTPTSPNTAPATQNESHDWSASDMKRQIYNARSNKSHPPTAPDTAPATQSHSHDSSSSHMKWRGATLVTVQHHQILRLPRNSEFKMSAENPWIASANIKMIRAWSEDNPN